MLGTSDAWSMSLSSHRPSKPAYYIEDCRIFKHLATNLCLLSSKPLTFSYSFSPFFCVNEIISHDLISNWIILVLEEFYTILSNVKHLARNLCTYSKPFTFNYSCSPFIHKGQARQEPQSFWREKSGSIGYMYNTPWPEFATIR